MHGDGSRARLVEGGPRSFPLSIRDWCGNPRRQSAMLGWLEAGGGIKLLDCREMEKQMRRRGETIVAGDSKYSEVPSFLGHWCHLDEVQLKLIGEILHVQMWLIYLELKKLFYFGIEKMGKLITPHLHVKYLIYLLEIPQLKRGKKKTQQLLSQFYQHDWEWFRLLLFKGPQRRITGGRAFHNGKSIQRIYSTVQPKCHPTLWPLISTQSLAIKLL